MKRFTYSIRYNGYLEVDADSEEEALTAASLALPMDCEPLEITDIQPNLADT